MMAGHRNLRKSEALIRRLLMSCWWPRATHCCFQDANTSFSSRGNTLRTQEGGSERGIRFLLLQRKRLLKTFNTSERNEVQFVLKERHSASRLKQNITTLFLLIHMRRENTYTAETAEIEVN